MEKLKAIIKWIAIDGLLHFLVAFIILVTCTPIIGVWWSLLISILASITKEAIDFFIEKDNNKQQVIHDLICDIAGIVSGLLTVLIWFLIN